MTGHQQRPPDFRFCSVIPGRGPIARSRASYDALCREPGIPNPGQWLWIPGPALTRRPGMTIRWM